MSKILITGASGLIGTRLTEMLQQQGHHVSHLVRKPRAGAIPTFVWDVERGFIDEDALRDAEAVIHLAGAGIADKRWTEKRKQVILESRIQSTSLLARYLAKNSSVKVVVVASAVGYYGGTLGSQEFVEENKPGDDFLARVVTAWEAEVDKIASQRVVKLRIGIVLSEKGGALKELMRPIRWGVGAPLGTGEQYMSWIHIDDLCRMFIKAVEDQAMSGPYNATGPYAVTNFELTRTIAKVLHKPLWLPAVPAFALKLVLGEMADMVLQGNAVSSAKIQRAGFTFNFPVLEEALRDLMRHPAGR